MRAEGCYEVHKVKLIVHGKVCEEKLLIDPNATCTDGTSYGIFSSVTEFSPSGMVLPMM